MAREPFSAVRRTSAAANVGVPQGNEGKGDVAAGGTAAPLVDHPVVVGLHAQQGELFVVGLQEHLAAEAGEGREAQRGDDAGPVHVLQPGHGVVTAGPHFVVGDRLEAEFLPSLPGHGAESRRDAAQALVDPRLALGVAHQPRSGIPELGRNPLLPDVTRFEHVVIDGDQPFRCTFVCHLLPRFTHPSVPPGAPVGALPLPTGRRCERCHITVPRSLSATMSSQPKPNSRRTSSVFCPCSGAPLSVPIGFWSNCTGEATPR